MSKAANIFKLILIALLIAFTTACSATKSNPYYKKRKQESRSKTEQLGRNRYFFSSGYQKKLNSTYKKKRY